VYARDRRRCRRRLSGAGVTPRDRPSLDACPLHFRRSGAQRAQAACTYSANTPYEAMRRSTFYAEHSCAVGRTPGAGLQLAPC
jgi:hypothetical protein